MGGLGVTGLFLRYCWRCNSTQTCAERGGVICECGEKLRAVDAHALIPRLGEGFTESRRRELVDASQKSGSPESA